MIGFNRREKKVFRYSLFFHLFGACFLFALGLFPSCEEEPEEIHVFELAMASEQSIVPQPVQAPPPPPTPPPPPPPLAQPRPRPLPQAAMSIGLCSFGFNRYDQPSSLRAAAIRCSTLFSAFWMEYVPASVAPTLLHVLRRTRVPRSVVGFISRSEQHNF